MPPLIEQPPPEIAARRPAPPRKPETVHAPADGSSSPTTTLIDQLLAEQRTLTAVDRFALRHDPEAAPAQEKYYRDLIPLAKPRTGEQYAFVVDLDQCSGCKACVSACHSLNGLDDGEMWRSVGLLVSETPAAPFHQHVTTACHHCAEPGCADGCPVLAYEKDPDTGIVRHLDDQCIGCQYCVLKCPYDVPKYSASRGIVRKCDMCHDRLAAGEAPACVQACPHEAIRIEIVNRSEVLEQFTDVSFKPENPTGNRQSAIGNPFLPGSPDPRITLPTTRYLSAKPLPAAARSADAGALKLEPAHWPLVVMLVITQLGAGMHLLHGTLFTAGWTEPLPVLALFALCALSTGLVASVAHLGRPLKAWRIFLGWRRSWMSREIIAFSIYAGLAALLVALPGNALVARATAVAALVSVVCSAMIYVDTGRPAWGAGTVFTKFFGTTLLLGATAGAVWSGWLAPHLAPLLGTVATVIRTVLFWLEWDALMLAECDPASPLYRHALTMLCLLRPLLIARSALFVASTVFSAMGIFNAAGYGAVWGTIACVTTVTSQVLERYAFFRASAPPRMPGGVA